MKTDMPHRDPRTGRFEKSEKLEKTAADRSDEIEHDLYGSDDDPFYCVSCGALLPMEGEFCQECASRIKNPLFARGCFVGVFLGSCVWLAVVVAVWAWSVH